MVTSGRAVSYRPIPA